MGTTATGHHIRSRWYHRLPVTWCLFRQTWSPNQRALPMCTWHGVAPGVKKKSPEPADSSAILRCQERRGLVWMESKAGTWRSQNVTLAVAWPLGMAGDTEGRKTTKGEQSQNDPRLLGHTGIEQQGTFHSSLASHSLMARHCLVKLMATWKPRQTVTARQGQHTAANTWANLIWREEVHGAGSVSSSVLSSPPCGPGSGAQEATEASVGTN